MGLCKIVMMGFAGSVFRKIFSPSSAEPREGWNLRMWGSCLFYGANALCMVQVQHEDSTIKSYDKPSIEFIDKHSVPACGQAFFKNRL